MLTSAYIAHNKLKAALLATAFALTLFLPLALSFLIREYQSDLTARADTTPLVLGARGDRYDLVLKSLYFSGGLETSLSAADLDTLTQQHASRAIHIPLHLGYSARRYPLVGTSLDYFPFRNLTVADGSLPLRLGDAVLGHTVARELGLGPGSHLITDQSSLFNIASTYPLKLRITGVLAPSGSPDDRAVFADIKTAWVVAGIGHGHADLASPEAGSQILEQTDTNVTGSKAVFEYAEITPENLASFHFHADRPGLPVSSILVAPHTPRDATLLKAKLSLDESRQLLAPSGVVAELLGLVFRIKAFLDRAAWLVYALTATFTTLVVILSLRLRRDERHTLHRIGCSRFTVARLQANELLILLALGATIALAVAYLLVTLFPNPLQSLT